MSKPMNRNEIKARLVSELSQGLWVKYQHLLNEPQNLVNESSEEKMERLVVLIATIDVMIQMNKNVIEKLTDMRSETLALSSATDQIELENQDLKREIQDLHKAIKKLINQ